MLQIEEITAGYGGVNILHGVSVEVGTNEMVTIIGPNGSGKSTLLKVLIGLISPQYGCIRLDGIDITSASPETIVRSGIGYVPQSSNVFPALTVKENIELACYVGKVDRKRSTSQMFDLFPQLVALSNRAAGHLSGGERQIVAFARALVLEPTLLVLDEPSAGLSPVVRTTVFKTINEIYQSGLSVLIVEQNARQILPLSDRGYVLVAGENRMEGTGAELARNPEVVDLYLGGQRQG